eukprot:TRINITY_DN40597_c0_g1_i1.p1 TRINITY_DN40597_c0_g1~~TRINITY_DN40597_c0_g1_i1.p1  ORF type:complete len:561 (-),score=111.99 TRINITY_DN40597_c0_g1_i1:15-1643(-)
MAPNMSPSLCMGYSHLGPSAANKLFADAPGRPAALAQFEEVAMEVTTVIEAMVRGGCTQLFQASDSGISPTLAREGRWLVAEALGLPAPDARKSTASAGRPRSAEAGARCPALDAPVLAEVCGLLQLHRAPLWPAARTVAARASRLLAVLGGLGRVSMMATAPVADDPALDGEAAAWVLSSISQLLAAVSSVLTHAGRRGGGAGMRRRPMNATAAPYRHAAVRSPRRAAMAPGGAHVRAGAGPVLEPEEDVLGPGDEVLAHWPLPTGDRSDGVEDAVVLGADMEVGSVRLEYADGMELEVPRSWIVQLVRRRTSPSGAHDALAAQRRMAALLAAEEDGEEADARMAALLAAGAEEDAAEMRMAALLAAGADPEAAYEATAGDRAMAALLASGAKEEDQALGPAACLGRRPISPADGADYHLLRLLERGAPLADICARVRALCSRPNGAGLQPLTASLHAALHKPGGAQTMCLEVLCILCNSSSDDAALARLFANAILLSRCDPLPCTARQLALLRKSRALSVVQLSKLESLFCEPPRWRPFA